MINTPYLEDHYYSDNQYAVSIKEDTAYPCLHSPKTTKETRGVQYVVSSEDQYVVLEIKYVNILKISNVVPTPRNPNTPYPIHWIRHNDANDDNRPAAASRGEGTGGRPSRGGAQVGDQGRGQGNGRNQNGDAVNDNIWGDISRGCTYKEFLACNHKEYDGKGGAIPLGKE
ncbi:hypothetical protein Tco_0946769 [Tanacetum coccineum]